MRARIIACIAAVPICLAGLAIALPPRRDVVTAIRIAAPPARVWAVLTDTAAYPAWNPDMVLKGALIPGRVIEHDQGGMVFHPTIVAATPGRELSWRGHIGPPQVFDALHYIRLRPDGDGTMVAQGEEMRGVLLWIWDAGQLLPGFQAMNAGLKARAEQPAAPRG